MVIYIHIGISHYGGGPDTVLVISRAPNKHSPAEANKPSDSFRASKSP